MITDEGKRHIKRYLAGYVPSIAEAVAVGIGDSVESLADERLAFEVNRSDVVLTGYDFVNDRLVFKAPIPEEFAGTIYEVGLFSTSVNELAGEYGSKLITTFDSDVETWLDVTTGLDSTFNSSSVRVGVDSLRHSPAASTTKTDFLSDIILDLSGHSAADEFLFSFNVINSNVDSVSFRFLTDTSNYYSFYGYCANLRI
jgi:hypothetical protein